MSYKQMTGNIISATKVEPAGKVIVSAASGVWNLQDQYDYRRGNNWPSTDNAVPTALVAGGNINIATIDQFVIATDGNATDFGDLTVGRGLSSGAGSDTRFIVVGGDVSNTSNVTIDFTTYSSGGTFSDFGDTNVRFSTGNNSPVSNNTRSCFALSRQDGDNTTTQNNISYITNASAGDATDFGNTSVARNGVAGLSSTTRGIFAGGFYKDGSTFVFLNTIDYITIGSTGNAADFGDLTANKNQSGGCASSTRGLIAGGGGLNVIEYITIASAGNGTDFGDLRATGYGNVALADLTKAVITVYADGSSVDEIDKVTIATLGNAADFGDLTTIRTYPCGGSSVAASVQS